MDGSVLGILIGVLALALLLGLALLVYVDSRTNQKVNDDAVRRFASEARSVPSDRMRLDQARSTPLPTEI